MNKCQASSLARTTNSGKTKMVSTTFLACLGLSSFIAGSVAAPFSGPFSSTPELSSPSISTSGTVKLELKTAQIVVEYSQLTTTIPWTTWVTIGPEAQEVTTATTSSGTARLEKKTADIVVEYSQLTTTLSWTTWITIGPDAQKQVTTASTSTTSIPYATLTAPGTSSTDIASPSTGHPSVTSPPVLSTNVQTVATVIYGMTNNYGCYTIVSEGRNVPITQVMSSLGATPTPLGNLYSTATYQQEEGPSRRGKRQSPDGEPPYCHGVPG